MHRAKASLVAATGQKLKVDVFAIHFNEEKLLVELRKQAIFMPSTSEITTLAAKSEWVQE